MRQEGGTLTCVGDEPVVAIEFWSAERYAQPAE